MFKNFHLISNKLRIPKLLLLNNVGVTKSEIEETYQATQVERDWYKAVAAYESHTQMQGDLKAGKLVKIEADANFLPILRYRNQELHAIYPPYLTPEAKVLLKDVSRRWRRECSKAGVSNDIRLSLTSMMRTRAYQETIIKAGKLAMPSSPHTRGEAFDIDGCAYYDGEVPINPREGKQKRWQLAFRKLHAALPAPKFGDYDSYEPQVHQILKSVLERMQTEGRLNFVHEHQGTTNACFHICRNPLYNRKK